MELADEPREDLSHEHEQQQQHQQPWSPDDAMDNHAAAVAAAEAAAAPMKLSHDDHLYQALQSDLLGAQQWVDVTLVGFDDGAMRNATCQLRCHKFWLAHRSGYLAHLLGGVASENDKNHAHVVLAGVDQAELDKLVHTLYDPDATAGDIELWREEAFVAPPPSPPVGVKLELEPASASPAKAKRTRKRARKPQLDDDGNDVVSSSRRRSGRSRAKKSYDEYEDGALDEEDLLEPAVRVKVELDEDGDGLTGDDDADRGQEVYNNDVDSDGEYKHDVEGDASTAPGGATADAPRRPRITLAFVTHHLKNKTGQVVLAPLDRQICTSSSWNGFKMIRYENRVVPFAYCKKCRDVLRLNDNKKWTTTMAQHKQTCPGASEAVDGPDDNEVVKIAKDEIEKLVRGKSDEIKFGQFRCRDLKIYRFRQLRFRGQNTCWIHCTICDTIVHVDDIDVSHECVRVMRDMGKVFNDTPDRIRLLEAEVVRTLYPFMKPVLLDGERTEAVQCSPCKVFFPLSAVLKEDFSHRCPQYKDKKQLERYSSKHLVNLPRSERKGANKPMRYKCTLCGDLFLNSHWGEIHMRTVHGEGAQEVLCTICGKSYSTVMQAQKHEMSTHRFQQTASKEYPCPQCPTVCKERSRLRRHIRACHENVTPYVCELCGKSFKWDSGLSSHMRIHGEKLIKCDFCPKSFHLKSTYITHRMIHTGEKPNACPVCDMKFISITACKIHTLKRHGIKVPRGQGMKAFKEQMQAKAELGAVGLAAPPPAQPAGPTPGLPQLQQTSGPPGNNGHLAGLQQQHLNLPQ